MVAALLTCNYHQTIKKQDSLKRTRRAANTAKAPPDPGKGKGETQTEWGEGDLGLRDLDVGCHDGVLELLRPPAILVSSHESATFRRGPGHCCGRGARLATSQGLLDLPAQALLLPTTQTSLSHESATQRG